MTAHTVSEHGVLTATCPISCTVDFFGMFFGIEDLKCVGLTTHSACLSQMISHGHNFCSMRETS